MYRDSLVIHTHLFVQYESQNRTFQGFQQDSIVAATRLNPKLPTRWSRAVFNYLKYYVRAPALGHGIVTRTKLIIPIGKTLSRV